jgi:hypothetical protein
MVQLTKLLTGCIEGAFQALVAAPIERRRPFRWKGKSSEEKT